MMTAPLEPMDWLRDRWQRFVRAVDSESITTLQTLYYVFITIAGLYLLLAANAPPEVLEKSLGTPAYVGWLLVNIICPSLTFLGRHQTRLAARSAPGEQNPGVPAAWLQLCGDGGIWGAILIYVLCVVNTTAWGQGVYAAFFVLMGVPGGFLFTLRSYRRLRQIGRRANGTL